MAAISHLKNIRGQLATAFGIHLVQGYNVLEDVTTPGAAEPEIVVVQVLGDGHGAGWDGPQGMSYRGHEIDPSAYHFHPGIFSRGDADPVQGIDAWFPTGITYSGTTYVVAKLPAGVASEGNASELQGIYRCLKLPNYNAAGEQIDRDGNPIPGGAEPEDYFYYSANPARVAAWLILFGQGLSPNRIDWAAWVAWRDYCDELIDWEDGTTTEIETALEWRSQGGMTVGSGGSATKGRGTSGVNAWDSGTTTTYACPVNTSGHRGIEYTISSLGAFMVGLTRATVLTGDGNPDGHTYRSLDIALYYEIGGALKVYASGAFIGTLSGGWSAGQTYRVVAEGGAWKFYRNGVAITHALSLPAPPAGALYGGISCNSPNSGVTAATYFPAATGTSTQTTRKIPRFEAHIAFTQPTSLQDALDQVCFMACADWQETPRIRFLTPQPAVEVGDELHAAQRQIVHHFDATAEDNIVRRSISAYPLDVRERWNFAEALFRDLDHRDLIEDYVQDERAGLQDAAGDANTPRIISPGQINLGNMSRSQALRVLKWLMRLRSDRVWFCELKAAADSLHVLPGDVVRVSHATYNWVEKLFLVIDAVDEEEGADERSFVLQEYDPADYYHDTDHSRGQRDAAPPTPSPYQPPPVVADVILDETQTTQADGTILSGIRGTVYFGNYTGKQLGRVWIKPSSAPSSAWQRAAASLLKPQPDTGADVFEIRGVEKIDYDIKVVSEAENTTQLPFSSHDTYSITIIGKQAAPAQPTGLSATMGENGMVVFSVNPPAESDFAFMRVYDGTGAVVRAREAGTKWEEPPNAATITRKVTFFNTSGRESVFSATYTFTLPSPTAPAGATATRDNANIVLKWTALEGLDYQVSADQSAILWQGKGGTFRVLSAITGAATYTYYVRSMRFNVASAWVQVQLVVSAPAAPTGAALTRERQALVLTWTAVAGLEYQVSADGSTPIWRGTTGSYRREGVVTAAGTYTYYVRALQDGVASTWTAASVVVSAQAAPSAVTLIRDGRAVVLTWTAVEGLEYEVSADQITALWKGRAGVYRREGIVTAAGTYTYSVRAIDNGIPGAWGSASVVVSAPASVTGFTLTRSARFFLAKWAKLDGLEYEYSTDGATALWRGAAGEYVESGIPAVAGTYTRYVRALDYGIAGAWILTTVTISAPLPPASATGSFDGLHVQWKLTASPSAEALSYRAKTTAGVLIADDIGLDWKQKVTSGTSVYTVRFYAVDSLGIESTTYTETTFAVPAPSAPTLALASAPEQIVLTVTPPATLPDGLQYDLARANDGSNIIARTSDLVYFESLLAQSPPARLFTRYARSVNAAGLTSGWASASTTYQPITAAPTLTADTARANPLSLPVAVATPVARAYVRNIILQVRAVGGAWPSVAEGTSGTFRFPGALKTITVPWDAGGAMEYRVALEDVLTSTLNDHVWTATQSYTFPKFVDSAIDPNANFMRKANWRYPIFTGGGTVEWTSAFAVKWSQAIIIEGLGSYVSPTGQVTLAANTAGTTLSAGQGIILRHVLGASTATAVTVTLASYTPPDEQSSTTEVLMFRRNTDNTLSTYLGVPLVPGEVMDSSVVIPMLTTFEARMGNALITKANIKDAYIGRLVADVGDVRLVLADKMGSRNFISSADQTAHAESVTWQDVVNMTAQSDGSYKRTGGADSSYVAGMVSARSVQYGDCYVEITAAAPATTINCNFGLVQGTGGGTAAAFDYGFGMDGFGTLYWLAAGGTFGTLGTYAAGDKLRVGIEGANAVWRKNGVALRTAAASPKYPMVVDTAFYNLNAVMQPATLYGVLAPTTGAKVRWQNLVGVGFDANDDLSRTVAGTSWGGAGAASLIDYLDSGQSGSLSATVDSTASVFRAFGLTDADNSQTELSIKYGVVYGGGQLYAMENGAYVNGAAAITTSAVSDLISVSREGTTLRVRKNGAVVWTFSTTYSGALYPDTAINDFGAKLQSVRLFKAAAVPQGVMIDCPGGTAEFSKSVIIGGTTVDRVVGGAYNAVTPERLFRANDYGPPFPHKVKAAAVYKWKYELQNPHAADIGVQLNLTLPAAGADTYANMDSIKRVLVKVINRFGDVVADLPPMQFTPGGGLTPWFWHPLKYAHPSDDATYEVRLENAYSWSAPFYVARGTFQQAPPSYLNRRDCPLEVCASSDAGLVNVAWLPAQQNAGQQTYQYRELGQAAWTTYVSNLTSTTDNYGISSDLMPGMWYEFRVGNNSVSSAWSNVAVARLSPQLNEADYLNPTTGAKDNHIAPAQSVVARPVSQTSNKVLWAAPAAGQISPSGYTIWRDGSSLATGQAGTSYTDTTASAGVTYKYQVMAEYTSVPGWGGTLYSAKSNPAVCTTLSALNATDPTGLTATPSAAQINLAWLLNGNTGAVAVEYKSYDPYATNPSAAGFWSSGVTTIPLSVGTTSRQVSGLTSATRYAFRVQAGTSNYTNVATADTAAVVGGY